jgi:hypothetical protein
VLAHQSPEGHPCPGSTADRRVQIDVGPRWRHRTLVPESTPRLPPLGPGRHRLASNQPEPLPTCPVSAGSPNTSNSTFDAIAAGLTRPWNSGVVEGHVTRVEMLKRQMFGGAGSELLRKRVLLA